MQSNDLYSHSVRRSESSSNGSNKRRKSTSLRYIRTGQVARAGILIGIVTILIGKNRCGFHDDELFLSHASITKLLAEFFEIDLKKLEIEKEAMLDAMREHHEAKDKAKAKTG
jgi:hypothetical protein